MKFSWALNLYDYEGDMYEQCVLAFCGDNTVLMFKNSTDLHDFADEILRCLPELRSVEKEMRGPE